MDIAAATSGPAVDSRIPDDLGTPQKLVVYATPAGWRFSVYTDRYSLEGALGRFSSPERARTEAAEATNRLLRRPVELTWLAVDAGWWLATIRVAGPQ